MRKSYKLKVGLDLLKPYIDLVTPDLEMDKTGKILISGVLSSKIENASMAELARFGWFIDYETDMVAFKID